jgi:hypothetical protein
MDTSKLYHVRCQKHIQTCRYVNSNKCFFRWVHISETALAWVSQSQIEAPMETRVHQAITK